MTYHSHTYCQAAPASSQTKAWQGECLFSLEAKRKSMIAPHQKN